MPHNIPVVPVALENGAWPTFHLSLQDRLEIVKGRGLQRGPGAAAGQLLAPAPHGQAAPVPSLHPTTVAATNTAIGPGGVHNSGGRTMDAQGHMVGPATPSVAPVPHVSPGNITPAKPPIRTAGPNNPSST